MQYTKHKNNQWLLNLGLLFLLLGSCLMTVACQTKEQKTASALKKCQQLLDNDNLNEATTCYGEAVLANPENGGDISQAGKIAFFKKCVSYKEKKDYKNAIICFDGFTVLEPKMANNYFQLADSYYHYFEEDAKATGKKDLELLDRAETAVKSGLEIKSDDIAARALYGQILEDEGKLKQAIEEYKKIIKINPQIPLFWVNIAFIQQKLGQNEESLKNYHQALVLDENNTLALYYLGALYEKINQPDNAIETYEKLLKIESSNEEILQRLKMLKEHRGKKNLNIKPKQKAKGAFVIGN